MANGTNGTRKIEDLGRLPHSELLGRRLNLPAGTSMPEQQELAVAEHRAFAREWAQESPVAASLSLPFAIPAYSAAKYVGRTFKIPALFDERTTNPSFREITEAYKGLGEGVQEVIGREYKKRKKQLSDLYAMAFK